MVFWKLSLMLEPQMSLQKQLDPWKSLKSLQKLPPVLLKALRLMRQPMSRMLSHQLHILRKGMPHSADRDENL